MNEAVHPGELVRSRREGPQFRTGALFLVLRRWGGPDRTEWLACAPVGRAPFRFWIFRSADVEPVPHKVNRW
ncbi:MAG: hypothetical protein Kow00109_28870 [Acidobacteriota bacterium]